MTGRKREGSRGKNIGATHAIRSHGHDGREEEDDRDKSGPAACPDVDKHTDRAQGPRARLERVEDELAQNRDAVRPVQRNGAEVEDGGDGNVAAQANEVDEDANERVQPHGQDGGIGLFPNLVPDPAAGQHLVAGKGPDGAGAGLQGGDADKVHNDKRGDGEEDGSAFAHDVVVDLHDGLLDGAGEDVARRVVRGEVERAHAKGEHNVEEPADDVGEAQGGGDGGGDGDGRVLGLFGNVGRGVVVGHGPGDGEEAKQETEAGRLPARIGLHLGEDVGRRVLVLLHDEEGDAAGEEDCDVDHGVRPCNLGQPGCVEAVDARVHDGQRGHDADNVALRRRIREIRADGDGGEKHLCRSVRRRCAAAYLANNVQPACRGEEFFFG